MVKHIIFTSLLVLIALFGSLPLWTQAKQTQQCKSKSGRILLTAVPSINYAQSVPVSVYVPPCYAPDRESFYPVIYLLHGSGADETQWPDLNMQSSADALIAHGAVPFVGVMPGAVYYNPVDYGEFVVKDLLPGIEAQFHVAKVRSGRGIGGLSLGGFWALKIAFLHPDLFAAVGGYSPVVDRGDFDDPLSLARQLDSRALQGLNIDLDVGDQDSLLYDTQGLAQVLRSRGLTVSLTIGQGGHDRVYWRAHTYDYFRFYLDEMMPPQTF